ncbi:AAA family ATPase [Halobaculum sp. MBLA0143]|uniref:AAA family ATPase n=1 Tax=Halobaculum sp. MBLA0143 TaxID=3079933 RepID=UPI0035256805
MTRDDPTDGADDEQTDGGASGASSDAESPSDHRDAQHDRDRADESSDTETTDDELGEGREEPAYTGDDTGDADGTTGNDRGQNRRIDSVDELVTTDSSGDGNPDPTDTDGTTPSANTDGTTAETGAGDESNPQSGGDRPANDARDDTARDGSTDAGATDTAPGDAENVGTPPGVTDTTVTPDSRSRSDTAVDLDVDEVLGDEDDSTGLFDDLLSGDPIFENKEVLRPSYTPQNLPHRNDQINQMATILVSALRGDTPSNILIYGKTGTGKTASAKFVSQELESTSQRYDVPCEVEYINCEVTDTQYRVLAQLANKFIEKNRETIADRLDDLRSVRSRAVEDASTLHTTEFDSVTELDDRIESLATDRDEMEEVPMTGWPTDRVYSAFFDAVDHHERVVVIMLDEVDKLVEKSGDDTLYNLSRMNSELEHARISIMGISNDLKFTDFLDPRVKSSLGEEEIVFPPYDANQLRDILQHRAEVAFEPDALTEDVIPLCAAFAAQEHGDARRALDLLRTAGELAERSQANRVEESHVRQAQDKIELDRVVEVVRTLPTQSKIVLFSITLLEKNGVEAINTGEVFNIYKRLCEEIDADVLTQRRVTDLISELDMLGIVNAVVVSKGRYGRTKEISLSVPLDETEAVLLSDSRLGDIDDVQPFVQARFDN